MTGLETVKKLKNAGFEAYFVGGMVRDRFEGKIPNDIDIATNASPDKILDIFRGFTDAKQVGKSFSVILLKNGVQIATYRKDNYFGLSHKNVAIEPTKSLREDLSRRDFTFNAMALDPTTDTLVDPFGGYNDLQNRVVRFVGCPETRIYEDPHRILRACRFLAAIDGKFHPDTLSALKQYGHLLEGVAPERIRLEVVEKVVKIHKASRFFEACRLAGLLPYVFPSLVPTVGHYGGDYHNEQVWEHSMFTGDAISPRFPLLKLAAYLHDVGKPPTFKRDENGVASFIGHEYVGASIIGKELKHLTFSREEIEYITQMIRYHMRFSGKLSPAGVRRLRKELGDIDVRDTIRMKLADRRGNLKRKYFTLKEVRFFVGMVRNVEKEKLKLEVTGHDVMEILGIPPGKRVGIVLKTLEEWVLEDPRINQRDVLLERIRGYEWE